MAVYVDDAENGFGRMTMCHMWADTIDELLAMADRIGVDRKWIQGHATLSFGKHHSASWVHFDIAKGKRGQAVAAGAIGTDRFGPSEHVARLRIATGIPEQVAIGQKRLGQIAQSRDVRRAAPLPRTDLLEPSHG